MAYSATTLHQLSPKIYAAVLAIAIMLWLLPIIVANAATGICYMALRSVKKPVWPLCIGFFITACSLLSLYWPLPEKILFLGYNAAFIGLAQGISLLPGVSRLAVTYVTGAWIGLRPVRSLYFSLALELCLILAALGKTFYERRKHIASHWWQYVLMGISFFIMATVQNLYVVLPAAYIFGAVVTPTLKQLYEGVKDLLPSLNWRSVFVLAASCIIAYGALELVWRMAIFNMLMYFGFYMLAVAVYAFFHPTKSL